MNPSLIRREMADSNGNNASVDESQDPINETTHPLLQCPTLLTKIVENLQRDTRDLKTFRLVCSTWNDVINETTTLSISISSKLWIIWTGMPSRMTQFTDLMTQPEVKLKCRNVTLGSFEDLNDTETIFFLESFGHEIRQLTIESVLNTISALFVLKNCTNLTHLTIEPGRIRSLEMPTMFEDAWNNGLPQLKSLTVFSNYTWMDIEDKYRSQFEFIIQLLSKASKVDAFNALNFPRDTLDQLSDMFILRPEIFSRAKRVHLNLRSLNDRQIPKLISSKINLTILEITELMGVTTNEFSKLLESYSSTLETLIINYKYPWGRSENVRMYSPFSRPRRNNQIVQVEKDFRLHFTSTMLALKHLTADSGSKDRDHSDISYCKISCTAPGNVNVLEQIPNLKRFWARDPETHADRSDPWERLFPTPLRSPTNNSLHNMLTEMDIAGWCIKTTGTAEEIRRHLPRLTNVTLSAEGKFLNEVVDVLSDSEISEFSLNFVQKQDEGFLPFITAITGMSPSDCEENENAENTVGLEKVRKSFESWIALRNLKLKFSSWELWKKKYSYDRKKIYLHLDNLSMKCGFLNWKQLECLTLTSFEVHPQQVSAILQNIALNVFDLKGSKINIWDDKNGSVPVELETIRGEHPLVELTCDSRYNINN